MSKKYDRFRVVRLLPSTKTEVEKLTELTHPRPTITQMVDHLIWLGIRQQKQCEQKGKP